MVELALYLPVLLLVLDGWGIGGAAVVWSGRALVVAVARAALAVGVHPPLAAALRALAPALVASLAGLAAALALAEAAPMLRLAAAPMLVLPAVMLGWRHGLGAAERRALAGRVVLALRLR